MLSDSSDSESDDSGNMFPCEAIITRRASTSKQLTHDKGQDIPMSFSNNSLRVQFKSSFKKMRSREKWILKSGRLVEDIMFAYGMKLKEERYVFSDFLL